MNLVEAIKYALDYNAESLIEFAEIAPEQYKEYFIKKKKGGRRAIYHPTLPVKSIQYIIKSLILEDLEVSSIAKGYIKNLKSPLKVIANGHKSFNYTIRVDFKDFFPSLTFEDLRAAITKNYSLGISEEEWHLIKSFLFIKKNDIWILPIGSPSSPIISNIILKEIDDKIIDIVSKIDRSSFVTRYADDVVFSSNIKGACNSFHEHFTNIVNSSTSPILKINEGKTLYMSKAGKRLVNGIVLTPDNNISLGRHYKRYIRKCVFDFVNDNLSAMSVNQLAGHLSYIRDIEKPFFNSLHVKYGPKVSEIKISPKLNEKTSKKQAGQEESNPDKPSA